MLWHVTSLNGPWLSLLSVREALSGVWRECLDDTYCSLNISARASLGGDWAAVVPLGVLMRREQQLLDAAGLLNPAKRKGWGSPYRQQLVQHLLFILVCVPELSVGQGDSRCLDLACWGLGSVILCRRIMLASKTRSRECLLV